MSRGHRPARTAPWRRTWGVLAGALCALLLAGCAVGVDAQPVTVNRRHVPFGLLKPAPPTTAPAESQQFVTLYLAGRERLVAASRFVATPVTLRSVLAALGEGPTSAEAADSLESPISTAAPLTLVRVTGAVATVSVRSTFTKLAERDQVIAAAQLVYTLTAYPGIDAVAIRIGGRAARIPTAKGTLSGQPLDRADYADLSPI